MKSNYSTIINYRLSLLAIASMLVIVQSAFCGTYGGGSGSAEDPFVIATSEHLLEIGANEDDWEMHFVMTSDIDLTGQVYKQALIAFDEEVSMHFEGSRFTGKFDGNGYKISNLTINTNGGDESYLGLFGYIYDDEAEIKNLDIENFSIKGGVRSRHIGAIAGLARGCNITNCTVNGSASGYEFVGGIAGECDGRIETCSSAGQVTVDEAGGGGIAGKNTGTVINCQSASEVLGGFRVGGIVGQIFRGNVVNCNSTGNIYGSLCGGIVGHIDRGGAISKCSFSGTLSGIYEVGGVVGYSEYGIIEDSYSVSPVAAKGNAGGLVGKLKKGEISNCYATGSVTVEQSRAGGLVGDFSGGTLQHSYATGNVTGGTEHVGGIAGRFTSESKISNCYATGDIIGKKYIGGLAGTSSESTIDNCYTLGTVTGETNVGGFLGINEHSTTRNCYTGGVVTGIHLTGGFVGYNSVNVTYSDCFWNSELNSFYSGTDNDANPAGVTGLTIVQMVSLETFTNVGWDFLGETANGTDDIWLLPNCGFPVFVDHSIIAVPDVMGLSKEEAVELITSAGGKAAKYYVHSDTVEPGYVINQEPSAGCESAVVTIAISDGQPYQAGSGTQADPFQIWTAEQMNTIGLNHFDWNKCFVLMSDIDLSEYTGLSYNIPGTDTIHFRGKFEGNKHSIEGLSITSSEELKGVGLFGYIGVSGEVKNLVLSKLNLNVENSTNVGGLAGENTGTIEGCSTQGTVLGNKCVGGLVGRSYRDTVANSYARCEVSGESAVGGFAGESREGIAINCYSIGKVMGKEIGNRLIGGFSGYGRSDYINCFWDNESNPDIEGDDYHLDDPEGLMGRTIDQLQTQETFTDYGWDFVGEEDNGINDYWRMFSCGSPALAWQPYFPIPDVIMLPEKDAISLIKSAGFSVIVKNDRNDVVPQGLVAFQIPEEGCEGLVVTITVSNGSPYETGTGTEEYPFEIMTAQQFNAIGENPEDWSSNFILIDDIDLSAYADKTYNVIGNSDTNFTGVLDGNGKTIINFKYTASGDNHIGLFGYVGQDGTIRNTGVTAVAIDAKHGSYIGSFAGINHGIIESCFASGTVSGSNHIGGLVGTNVGIIANCFSTCSISGDDSVGGLVGTSGGSITNCYSVCTVIGGASAGCLVGHDSGCSYSGSIWSSDLNHLLRGVGSIEDPEGVFGKTAVEMQSRSTFAVAGWDFVGESINGDADIWSLPSCGWPSLFWQSPDTVPDVIGLSLANATEAITSSARVSFVKLVRSEIFPSGQVLSQEPPGGCNGTAVTITFNLGFPYQGGSGTESDPFQVWTTEHMNGIGVWSEGWDKHFILMDDIDLSGYQLDSFNIIGNEIQNFTGVFDGNGYSISNFTYVSSDESYVGLFGYIGIGGEVRDYH